MSRDSQIRLKVIPARQKYGATQSPRCGVVTAIPTSRHAVAGDLLLYPAHGNTRVSGDPIL